MKTEGAGAMGERVAASGAETAEGGRVAVEKTAVETEEMAGGEGVQVAPVAAEGCKAVPVEMAGQRVSEGG